MWPDRRLCDLLQIEHPIIQAPMLGTCTPALVSSVSNAGGMGSLACGWKTAEVVQQETAAIRERTNRSFCLNFFVVRPSDADDAVPEHIRECLRPWYDDYDLGDPPTKLPPAAADFGDEQLELVLSLLPKAVSFHFGVPESRYLVALRNAGIAVISSATNVAEARALDAAGVDAIIAQGWEAGGHRGSHIWSRSFDGVGAMALVPQVVDAVSVPVIAAGTIGDGRGIAAVFALGASGVQMGTAFLRCPEAATDLFWRERLQHSTDRDTMVTDVFSGAPARIMKSRFSETMERDQRRMPEFPRMFALVQPIRDAADPRDVSFLPYGQAAPLSMEAPAAEVMAQVVDDALAVMRGLASP
jgi:nitronate monooxygenase